LSGNPVHLAIHQAIRDGRIPGPDTTERVLQISRLIPRASRVALWLCFYIILPLGSVALLYFPVAAVVNAIWGGWSIQTRWKASVILIPCVIFGYLASKLALRVMARGVSAYVPKE